MKHLTAAVRAFPTPVNKTDMRSFMALMQQVSYSTAVAPLLLPFRKLLKDGEDWVWTEELDTLLEEAKMIMAMRVEEGIKIFDPYKVTLLISDWCKHGVGYIITVPARIVLSWTRYVRLNPSAEECLISVPYPACISRDILSLLLSRTVSSYAISPVCAIFI